MRMTCAAPRLINERHASRPRPLLAPVTVEVVSASFFLWLFKKKRGIKHTDGSLPLKRCSLNGREVYELTTDEIEEQNHFARRPQKSSRRVGKILFSSLMIKLNDL